MRAERSVLYLGLLVCACSAVTDYDRAGVHLVQPAAATGYVEFYYDHALALDQPFVVYVLEDGRETHLGRVARGVHREAGRHAVAPGVHVFTVRLGTAMKQVSAEVVGGMVTPVRMTVMATDSPGIAGITSAVFDLDARVEGPAKP